MYKDKNLDLQLYSCFDLKWQNHRIKNLSKIRNIQYSHENSEDHWKSYSSLLDSEKLRVVKVNSIINPEMAYKNIR